MSFILDALRKSEHDRQRGSGPGIAEVAVARRAERGNPWAAVAIGLLLLNLLALGGWLLSKSLRDPAPAAATAAAQRAAQQAPTITADPVVATPASVPAAAAAPRAPREREAAPANPLAAELSADPRLVDESVDPEIVAAASAPPSLPVRATTPAADRGARRTTGGRVVYETQPLDAPPVGPRPPPSDADRSAALPTADQVASEAGLPELHLDIHVYSTIASERFVFVNGAKYREGESLQAGPTVESITPEGVVLDYRGSRFVLPRP